MVDVERMLGNDAAIRRTEAVVAKLEQVQKGLLNDLLTRGLDKEGRLRPKRKEAL